jgi:hypothetical protein
MSEGRLGAMRTPDTGGCTMNKVLVGVVSAVDFERAQGCISGLSNCSSYDDWLDSRYGRFMGLSLGGAEACLETVALDEFLNWCGARRIPATEAALDAYAEHAKLSSRRKPLSAA